MTVTSEYTKKNAISWTALELAGSTIGGSGGNQIIACNPYHRLIYIFSIFDVPANVTADLLDAFGLL